MLVKLSEALSQAGSGPFLMFKTSPTQPCTLSDFKDTMFEILHFPMLKTITKRGHFIAEKEASFSLLKNDSDSFFLQYCRDSSGVIYVMLNGSETKEPILSNGKHFSTSENSRGLKNIYS